MNRDVTLEAKADLYRIAHLQQLLLDRQIRKLEGEIYDLREKKVEIDRQAILAREALLEAAQFQPKDK